MVNVKVQKLGNTLIVELPVDEVERLGISEGQMLSLDIVAVDEEPALRADLLDALMETWDEDVEAYRYLAER
jgi:antitoxin component of MazEF toxin-antitoxin module